MRVYSANGNIIGIKQVSNAGTSLRGDKLREIIVEAKGLSIDTVMFVDQPAGDELFDISTNIFEPNAGLEGSWSTMCGNGVRAVADYFQNYVSQTAEIRMKTPAGILVIQAKEHGYRVCMGKLYTWEAASVQKYVSNFVARDWAFIHKLFGINAQQAAKIDLGFTSSDAQNPDGEPHLCIRLQDGLELEKIRTYARNYGQAITNNFLAFPEGMNANFYSISGEQINLVTHERNLGTNPDKCITQSCGTGSSVVGSINLNGRECVEVVSLGGSLLIENQEGQVYMTGGAEELSP